MREQKIACTLIAVMSGIAFGIASSGIAFMPLFVGVGTTVGIIALCMAIIE